MLLVITSTIAHPLMCEQNDSGTLNTGYMSIVFAT